MGLAVKSIVADGKSHWTGGPPGMRLFLLSAVGIVMRLAAVAIAFEDSRVSTTDELVEVFLLEPVHLE